MIYGKLKDWKFTPGFSGHPVWEEAFHWIEEYANSADEGIYPLTPQNCFVRVMAYDLKERGAARYEGHRNTIDLQFTIQGSEGIEIMPVDELTPEGDYLKEKDCQFYKLAERGAGLVDNLKGYFCVLFPHDGHMPKLKVGSHERVRKLVVKIPVVSVS